jgi:hypothetical protein
MRLVSTVRGWLMLASAVCAAVAVGLAIWLLAFSGSGGSAPQARQYLDVTACLLTGPQGVSPGSPAAPVWASMEDASVQSRVMVSYLTQMPEGGARLLLNSLVQRRCGVIITTDAPPATVLSVAEANPEQRFLLVTDSAAGPTPANTTVVSTADAATRVGGAVRALAATA